MELTIWVEGDGDNRRARGHAGERMGEFMESDGEQLERVDDPAQELRGLCKRAKARSANSEGGCPEVGSGMAMTDPDVPENGDEDHLRSITRQVSGRCRVERGREERLT